MLQVKKVSFAYDNEPVLKNINFSLKKGENLSLIGASGCGKSTLLQLIYGLFHTDGKITWKEKELLGPKFNLVPGEPFIKYLAQDFDLMPPLTVAENVGKYLSNLYPIKKKRRINELLQVVEIQDLANQKAKHLSGGQQQRVALARALANEPELLLLDEPFSHIDHFRKNNLRRKLFKYLKERNITCIVATHDSTDALSFADKTIVMKDGRIHAMASPKSLYNNPPNKYVASLFGDVNELMLKSIDLSSTARKKVLIYPHEISIDPNSSIRAKVERSYFKGDIFLVEAKLDKSPIFFENPSKIETGKEVGLAFSNELLKRRSVK